MRSELTDSADAGQSGGSLSRANGAPRLVLVADDEVLSLRVLESLLRAQGYDVVVAASGAEALSLLSSRHVDAMLLDVMMPGMDGIELCTRVRRELGNADLPIVFTTGLDDRETRLRAKEAGGDDFLTKPVDGLELLVRVDRLVKLREARALEHRHAELVERALASSAENLLRMERFKALGCLAAAVGHEIANLAMVLQLALERIHARARAGLPFEATDLGRLDFVGARLDEHAVRLLHLGQGGAPTGPDGGERIDACAVVAEAVAVFRDGGQAPHAQITLEACEPAPRVPIGKKQLEHVVFNLLSNAADALPGASSEAPSIGVRVESPDALGRVRIDVTDNGVGIEAAHLQRVFEPYFTTKPSHQAAGVGLCLVQRIVESVGGRVVLVSRPGLGTKASVDLPSA